MALGTSMNASASESESPAWLAPIGWFGRLVVGTLGHLGGTALVMISAATSFVRSTDDDDEVGLWSATVAELSWMLYVGCPLVGLVHVAMGSFLSLQAYYGSTFVDGTGAVVGVGLLRNLASMMTGLTLAGFLPVRIVPELRELRRRRRIEKERLEASAGAGRGPAGRFTADDREPPIPSPGRLAGPRLLAAVVATPLLSIWGFVVGTVVGWQSSGTLMGLPSETFFLMFVRMIWFRDVVGLLVKGSLFGLFTAALACSEGLSDDESETDEAEVRVGSTHGAAILRATCLSMAAILLINMTWFVLIYHAVPVYGPSLLQPPTP